MFIRLDQRPNFFDASVPTNKKRHAMRAKIFPSHERLFTPNAISLDNFFVFVGQKRERQFKFFDKFVVLFHRIRADTENNRATFFEFGKTVAKGAGFLCAARRIVFRIKIKNDVFTFEIRE